MKKKPIEGRIKGCLNCGVAENKISMNAILAVGFGVVAVTCGGKRIWSGDDDKKRLIGFERMARKKPRADWRVRFDAPLSSRTYQRHGLNKWVLIEQGNGFA